MLEKSGTLHVLHVAPPQDVAPDQQHWADAVVSWLLQHAPGQTAAALRIALGEES